MHMDFRQEGFDAECSAIGRTLFRRLAHAHHDLYGQAGGNPEDIRRARR